ncbi:hypothetical protein Acr_25g0005490 [Actinidia rufa]|uniref:Transposase (putative) gypsy type domain-containing protein n=1 Tax=Actinidia rufa TaxID=165716 RepID=A0A7J0GZ69_9ERIC|nr:hypothetical protein Acr_25g0005490 [Actinidia rufa]
MTQGKLDRLRESCSFPAVIQIRLPEADDTIVSTRPGEVAFYEVDFQVGLRLPIHPTMRRILAHYNVCPVQLAPNEWRSMVGTLVLWQFKKFDISLNEFRHLFGLFNNPRLDSGWLYFKARPKLTGTMLAIDKFKSSDEYKGAVEGATSSYFGKSFDLCKKKIGILHPNGEDEEEDKDVSDTNPPQ